MEDLSSLEGPPMQDERFAPESYIISPISPEDIHDLSSALPMITPGCVSPISTATRSFHQRSLHGSSISSLNIPFPIQEIDQSIFLSAQDEEPSVPLRNSRSQSNLRDSTEVPPRPASTDNNKNTTTAPFWLMVNGRLVWVEELQLWVLWDDVVTSSQHDQQGDRNRQGGGKQPQGLSRKRTIRTWKSLPPLPHEIHHLLPPDMGLDDGGGGVGSDQPLRPKLSRSVHNSRRRKRTKAQVQFEWASVANQMGPHLTRIQKDFQKEAEQAESSHQRQTSMDLLPPPLQPSKPQQQSQQSSSQPQQQQSPPPPPSLQPSLLPQTPPPPQSPPLPEQQGYRPYRPQPQPQPQERHYYS